jgi:hypothetical protein
MLHESCIRFFCAGTVKRYNFTIIYLMHFTYLNKIVKIKLVNIKCSYAYRHINTVLVLENVYLV